MAFKIITLPFIHEDECFFEDKLNEFCLNKKIISYKTEFFCLQERPYWTVFLEYEMILEGEQKTDINFTGTQKILFQRLREWRKQKAEDAGMPVYIICTNKQLQDVVLKAPKTIEALKMINGFGKKKIEKYGRELLDIIAKFFRKDNE